MNHIVGNVAHKHAPLQHEALASLHCRRGAASGPRKSPTTDIMSAAREDSVATSLSPCFAEQYRRAIGRQSVTGVLRGALTLSGAGVA